MKSSRSENRRTDHQHSDGIAAVSLTAENTEQVVVSVKDGMLLMFPAWLQRSVDPNRSATLAVGFHFDAEALQCRPPWVPPHGLRAWPRQRARGR